MNLSAPILFSPNKPGAFASLPFDQYLAAPGVSKSALDHFHECPRQYEQYQLGMVEDDPTAEMIFGKVGHSLVLEGKRDFYVRPQTYPAPARHEKVKKGLIREGHPLPWNANATDCAEWLEAHADKPILSPSDADTLEAIAQYIRTHPKASALLSTGTPEVSTFAVDPQTGLFLKGRPDWVSETDVADAKFLADVSRQALPRTVIKRRYHVQLAMYRRLLGLNGIHPTRFWVLAVERVAWGKINLRTIPKAIIDIGEIELDRDLAGLRACIESDSWPDPSGTEDDEEDLVFPNWAYWPEGDEKDELIIGGKSHAL